MIYELIQLTDGEIINKLYQERKPVYAELREEHIKLLNRLYFRWENNSYEGNIASSSERPYGNSDIFDDIVEILGLYPDMNPETYDEIYEEEYDSMMKWHKEMGMALRIVLSTKSFVPGLYVSNDSTLFKHWTFACGHDIDLGTALIDKTPEVREWAKRKMKETE